MTTNDLIYANELKEKILKTEMFISDLKCNRNIRIFNRAINKRDREHLGVVISDHMRPYTYYELDKNQREKLIKLLEEDLSNYKKEFELL